MKLPGLPKIPAMSLPPMPRISIPGLPAQRKQKAAQQVDGQIQELRTAFMERAKDEEKRVELVTDTEYWCCLCFETREQKEAILQALGLLELGDKYLDGRQVARKLGVDPGAKVVWPKTKGLSERLKRHVE